MFPCNGCAGNRCRACVNPKHNYWMLTAIVLSAAWMSGLVWAFSILSD